LYRSSQFQKITNAHRSSIDERLTNMENIHKINPFMKRDEHSRGGLIGYKVLTILSWFLVHIVNIHFAWNAPAGDHTNRTIWGQNKVHPSPFSLNPTIVDIYWFVILIMQIGYIYHLFAGSHVTASANVGGHFMANNLLMFGFVLLWVHSHLVWAELLLVVNFFNLSSLYFRHSTTPLLVHIPVVSGPLAWNFVALFWCGAASVGASHLAARIVANIFIWSWLGYGLFFLLAYKDWTMGLALSVLAASLGVHQFTTKVVALQWIFAFAIMGALFVCTIAVAIPGFFGKDISLKRNGAIIGEDQERAPLLQEEA